MDPTSDAPIATSAAVPAHIDDGAPTTLAQLDEPAMHELAAVMARWWTRIGRVGWIGVFAPISGCTALTAVLPGAPVAAVAWFLVLSTLPAVVIARGLARRAIMHEAELLGCDRAAQKRIAASLDRARRPFIPLFGQAAREKRCRETLRELRERAR